MVSATTFKSMGEGRVVGVSVCVGGEREGETQRQKSTVANYKCRWREHGSYSLAFLYT